MRNILRHSNLELLREIQYLRETLLDKSSSVPPELDIYCNWVLDQINDYYELVTRNIQDLDSGRGEILPEVLSNTQSLTWTLHLFNQQLLSPILRARPSDRLCLKLMRWLHSTHPKTREIPVALSDGSFASWPVPPWPTIYFMPPSAQQQLLYLPLFFHEFGHLLYAAHKAEMDDLTTEFQVRISELLTPSSHRDDSYSRRESEQRRIIVETWYSWLQELFCDSIGLVIGGPAFAYAFSMHLQMLGRGEYHLPPDRLAHRVHPVTWLRVHLLADQMRRIGFKSDAETLEKNWSSIAQAMGVVEDYYGYYIPQFEDPINDMVADMLTETEPRRFTNTEVSMSTLTPLELSPIQLLNQAWREFRNNSSTYSVWESEAVQNFLKTEYA